MQQQETSMCLIIEISGPVCPAFMSACLTVRTVGEFEGLWRQRAKAFAEDVPTRVNLRRMSMGVPTDNVTHNVDAGFVMYKLERAHASVRRPLRWRSKR